MLLEEALGLKRGFQGIGRPLECGGQTVPTGREDEAVIGFCRIADDRIMAHLEIRHRSAVFLPKACRALNIGKEERDRSRGDTHGHSIPRHIGVRYGLSVPRFWLSALGVDSPGIVAAVSGALGDAGCNLEDSTMTILQGHFAILLVVSAADEMSVTSLEVALAPVSETFDLLIAVRSIEGAEPGPVVGSGSEALSISIHGADRPGIVHDISGALADAGGNVVDLSTQLVGEPENPVYVMTLRAIVPRGDSDRVAVAVKTTADSLGVQCTVREDESDLL